MADPTTGNPGEQSSPNQNQQKIFLSGTTKALCAHIGFAVFDTTITVRAAGIFLLTEPVDNIYSAIISPSACPFAGMGGKSFQLFYGFKEEGSDPVMKGLAEHRNQTIGEMKLDRRLILVVYANADGSSGLQKGGLRDENDRPPAWDAD